MEENLNVQAVEDVTEVFMEETVKTNYNGLKLGLGIGLGAAIGVVIYKKVIQPRIKSRYEAVDVEIIEEAEMEECE